MVGGVAGRFEGGGSISASAQASLTGRDLLEQAYNRYYKFADLDGALEIYKTLILHCPGSPESEAAKSRVRKILSSTELFQKAYQFQHKSKNIRKALNLYKMLMEVFPDSPDAERAQEQIEKIESGK